MGGAVIQEVNLNGAFLPRVWLSDASLPYLHLTGAVLQNAICEGTSFWCTNLKEADVDGACFTEAVFEMANLVGVRNLENTQSLEYAIFHLARVTPIEKKIIEDALALRPLFWEIKSRGK